MTEGKRILAPPPPGGEAILSLEALAFLERLHRQFEPTRQNLLKKQEFTEFLTLPAYPHLE
jgi:malate synthase